jgi:REP element-mobilizing transposase RayT
MVLVLVMKRKPRQREFGFVSWGGKRRGAGRKPKGERAGVSHARRAALAARFPVLVTLRLREGLPSLRYDDSHAVLKQALAAGSREEFRVVHYSLQSNHVHVLVESKDARALSRGMTGLAVRLARGLNRLWRRVGRVFSDRYHSLVLRTPRAVRSALVYLLQNARKHGAWTARRPDIYSSGAEFDGWKGMQWNLAESSAGFLGRARTWLLAVGWRRHGLIDVREAPAAAHP